MYQVRESDWKLFCQRLPKWQERYMEGLFREYTALRSGEGLASEKFWELEKRTRQDKRRVGVCAEIRRSMLWQNILALLQEEAITFDNSSGQCNVDAWNWA